MKRKQNFTEIKFFGDKKHRFAFENICMNSFNPELQILYFKEILKSPISNVNKIFLENFI